MRTMHAAILQTIYFISLDQKILLLSGFLIETLQSFFATALVVYTTWYI
jgi:hypothetical protein